MAAEDATAPTVKVPMPPYIAFKTLTDIIDRMEREEPPTRVDPTYLDTYAGGYRPTVIGNLQTLGLLTKEGVPTQVMLGLVAADESGRKKLIGDLLRRTYPDVLALPANSTQGEFLEVFTSRGATGDTRRKAVSFFLKACAFAGISTGTHWKTPPAGSSGGAGRRRSAKAQADPAPAPQPPAAAVAGETVTVDLGDAGRVEVLVDVRWLQLDDETFTSLRRAITDLKALASAASSAPHQDAGTSDDEDGAS